jgi:hypothetical protein
MICLAPCPPSDTSLAALHMLPVIWQQSAPAGWPGAGPGSVPGPGSESASDDSECQCFRVRVSRPAARDRTPWQKLHWQDDRSGQ